MWDGVTVLTKPTLDAITLASAKAWMNIDYDDHDELIAEIILGAVGMIDGLSGIGYALMTQTWKKTYDLFPVSIVLPGWPIKSVTSVKYIDVDGAEQTLDAANYRVDLTREPVRVHEAWNTSWPTTRLISSAVSIEYVLGETDHDNIDHAILSALKQIIAHHYEMREAVSETSQNVVPMGAHRILIEYSRGRYAA